MRAKGRTVPAFDFIFRIIRDNTLVRAVLVDTPTTFNVLDRVFEASSVIEVVN